MSELTGIVSRHCRIFSGSRDDRCSVREERPGTGGNSRHRAPAEAARAFSSGCSGGAAASIWAAAAFTPRRFASVKLLARASFRHHGVCSQTRTRQMLSGGWGADAGCTEAGRQGRPRPRARPCCAGEALSARALVQGLTCHRKRRCRGRFRCLSPRSAQLPVPRLRRSPPRWRVPA